MKFNKDYKDEVDTYFEEKAQSENLGDSTEFEEFLKFMDTKDDTGEQKSRELILDLDSTLESFFTGLIIISVVGIIIIFVLALSHASLLQWIFIPVISLVISIVLRTNLDEYYILDADSQKILFRRKFFGNEERKPVAEFSDIFAATTSGEYYQTKHSSYWSYSTMFVLKNGKTIRITDHMREEFDKAKRIAKDASDFLKIPYRPGNYETHTMIVLDKTTGEPKLSFVDHFTYIMKTRLIWYLVGIASFILFFVFIMSR